MTSDKEKLVCDFCFRPNPIWKYPCEDFSLKALELNGRKYVWTMLDFWAACDDCARFVEQHEVDQLAFLVSGLITAHYLAEEGLEFNSDTEHFHTTLYGEIRTTYRMFQEYRTGPRELIA